MLLIVCYRRHLLFLFIVNPLLSRYCSPSRHFGTSRFCAFSSLNARDFPFEGFVVWTNVVSVGAAPTCPERKEVGEAVPERAVDIRTSKCILQLAS